MRGQLLAIVIVIGSGIANFVAFRSVEASLVLTQRAYYEESQFADVFISARRVPESVHDRMQAIPGVAHVETRVVTDVMLDIPGLNEPASGLISSIPDHGQPLLNRLHVQSGRWIRAGADDEVIVSSAFAEANDLQPGDIFSAVINGRWRPLTIVGIALSSEYVLEIRPGSFMIDNKRYGIMWMGRNALAAAYDMKGAFNSALVRLEPGASERTVIEELDVILKQYGSFGAIGREDQMSHRFLTDEIAGLRIQALIVPSIFLGVAIFLLNIALLRLVSTQRMYIAILKAFGYGNVRIALHYIGFGIFSVAGGTLLGLIGGYYIGDWLVQLYTRFYRFPMLRFDMPEGVILGAVGLSALAAVLGAVSAVRTALKLPPAEAMRPEAPRNYRAGFVERWPIFRRLDPVMLMIVRNIVRRPVRASIGILSVALAMSILVMGRYMVEMFDTILDVQFNRAAREDAVVTFVLPRSASATMDLLHLPGVMRVEPFRTVGVDLEFGRHIKRTSVTGVMSMPDLHRVSDMKGAYRPVAPDGITISAYLAEKFGASVGDTITVKLLEGDRRSAPFIIHSLVDEIMGVQAYMSSHTLAHLLREEGSLSGAYLQVDEQHLQEFYEVVKRTPTIAGVMLRNTAIQSFDDNYKENMDVSSAYLVAFAAIIAFGVVYNSARIALSERGNELASLRVLGFTRTEISVVLLGEQVVLMLVALPVGMALGAYLSSLLPDAMATDLFRFPFSITMRNLGLGSFTIIVTALVSGFFIRRRLQKLDLIAVLKSRE